MAFGTATVVTTVGKRTAADRMQTTPTRNPFKFVALGVGATGAARTAVVGDTALSSELAEGRTSGTESTVTTTNTNDTYQVVGTVTATGTRAVDEAGLFDASTVGNMGLSATFPVINLLNGDSLALTGKIQFT
jgi:hypothetical protein